MTIIHIGAAASTGSEALPNTSSGADAPTTSNSQLSETTQILDNTLSSTRIDNLDENELSVADRSSMGLSQDMTSKSTADASVGDKQPRSVSHLEPVSSYQQEDPQQQTSISSPGRQHTQQEGQIVENTDGESEATLHTDIPPTTSQMDEPRVSQTEQTLKQQKEQQQPQDQQMGGASQQLGGASKQMGEASQQQQQQSQQQTVQGTQQSQQQPQQEARLMVVWNGIMEVIEVVCEF